MCACAAGLPFSALVHSQHPLHAFVQPTCHQYVYQTCPAGLSNPATLMSGFEQVMYTVMQSLTKDGRDRSLDYKISGAQDAWCRPESLVHG